MTSPSPPPSRNNVDELLQALERSQEQYLRSVRALREAIRDGRGPGGAASPPRERSGSSEAPAASPAIGAVSPAGAATPAPVRRDTSAGDSDPNNNPGSLIIITPPPLLPASQARQSPVAAEAQPVSRGRAQVPLQSGPHAEQPLEGAVRDLRAAVERNEGLRREIAGLREQLFGGGSVGASRRAVEAGDNIKILTGVSVLFLPLTFVTSVFGITEFTISANDWRFPATMVAVCVPFSLLLFILQTRAGMAAAKRLGALLGRRWGDRPPARHERRLHPRQQRAGAIGGGPSAPGEGARAGGGATSRRGRLRPKRRRTGTDGPQQLEVVDGAVAVAGGVRVVGGHGRERWWYGLWRRRGRMREGLRTQGDSNV